MKVRWSRGVAAGIKTLVIIIVVIFCILLFLYLFGFNKIFDYSGGGKFHVDVIIPAEGCYDGRPMKILVLDAHDRLSGDMTHPVMLPDSTIVYVTSLGANAFKSCTEKEIGDIKGNRVPLVFRLKKDTIWDWLTWIYITRFRGSQGGSPEAATGNR